MNIIPNYLMASRIQAAFECLPRTCEEHRAMNATETEMRIANDMVDYLEEYVRQRRCDPTAVVSLFMARMFSHEDKAMHVDGIKFSSQLQDVLPGAGS